MLKQYIFVDGACCHQEGRGAWAVVNNTEQYSGILKRKGIDSEYCELFAIYQALLLSKTMLDRVVILTDNNVATNLNKKLFDFKTRIKKRDRKNKKNNKVFINKSLLKQAYHTYHKMPNVEIKQIRRHKNRVADKLAKKTLRDIK